MQASIRIISEKSIDSLLEKASLEVFRKSDFEEKDLTGYEEITQFFKIENNNTNIKDSELLTIAGISCLKYYRLKKMLRVIALRYDGSVYATYFGEERIRIII